MLDESVVLTEIAEVLRKSARTTGQHLRAQLYYAMVMLWLFSTQFPRAVRYFAGSQIRLPTLSCGATTRWVVACPPSSRWCACSARAASPFVRRWWTCVRADW